MDYSRYEIYDFDNSSAFNLSTGYKERSYNAHWHSYGEILLVGPGDTNVFMVNQKEYKLKNNLTADDLSQASMARMAGVSKDYFSRIFKNITGMNYSKWLNTIRLEKATILLAQEKMTLTEVAMLSGFQSIPSFNRVFRDEKGMSPGEYRALFTDVKDSNS